MHLIVFYVVRTKLTQKINKTKHSDDFFEKLKF